MNRIVPVSLGEVPPLSPRDVWLRTHIYQQGNILHGVTYIVAAGQPAVFRASVDLNRLGNSIARLHTKLHGRKNRPTRVSGNCVGVGCAGGDEQLIVGWFPADVVKTIGRSAKRLGRTKLVKGLARGAKSVVRSKITGAVLAGAAVVFPPVGVPALAAYGTANVALKYAEDADNVRKGVAKLAKRAKRSRRVRNRYRRVSKRGRARITYKLKRLPVATRQRLKSSIEAHRILTEAGRRPRVRDVLGNRIRKGARAKQMFKDLVTTSRYAQRPAQKRAAKKLVKITNIVAANRARLRAIRMQASGQARRGETGLVIDQRGRIIPGEFVAKLQGGSGTPDLMLAARGKVRAGFYTKIAGCVGCV